MFLGIDLEDTGSLFTVALVYALVVVVALWLTMIIWTYRDMRARSRDSLGQIFFALIVTILTIPGLLIYLFLRPRETLSEAYERSLEEEALLQEIEEKPSCPGCGQRVHANWQVCPACHTRLKNNCSACGKLLELSWKICPYCTANQHHYSTDDLDLELDSLVKSQSTENTPQQQQRISLRRQASPMRSSRDSASLEFIDGDEF